MRIYRRLWPRVRIALSAWILLALVTSNVNCIVGPKYHKPDTAVPPSYKEQEAPAAETGTWKKAEPSDALAKGRWWEVFNDSALNGFQEKVLISNQSLKVAEAQFRQARALVHADRAAYYPTITAGPSATVSNPSVNRSFRPSTTASTFVDSILGADFSYEADLWGRVRNTVAASSASAQSSAADLENVRLSIQSELAIDYFILKSLDAERELLDSTVEAYQKALQLTTNRYRSGVASGAEVAQAETQLEATRAQAIDLDVQRAQMEHAIAFLVGEPASSFSIPKSPVIGSAPVIPAGVPSELLERRPDIASNERRIAAANAQIGVARAAFFPSLLLTAGVGVETVHFANLLSWPSHFWSIGPSLVQTVFDGGRRRAVSEQAQASYDAAVASYRDTVLRAFQEVEDSLAALKILSREADVQNSVIKAAERSASLAVNRYKGGIVSYLEVIIAQSAALASRRTAVGLLQRQMVASVMLMKALGGGWDASLLPSARTLESSAGSVNKVGSSNNEGLSH